MPERAIKGDIDQESNAPSATSANVPHSVVMLAASVTARVTSAAVRVPTTAEMLPPAVGTLWRLPATSRAEAA